MFVLQGAPLCDVIIEAGDTDETLLDSAVNNMIRSCQAAAGGLQTALGGQ